MEKPIYKDGTLYFKIEAGEMTLPYVKKLSRDIKQLVKAHDVKLIIADTHIDSNNYTPEIDKVFLDLFEELPKKVDKYAAMCGDPILKLETNYVFKQVGVADRFKAFSNGDEAEMQAFTGVDYHIF